MRSPGRSATARWAAAQRARLERTRPSTPGGDLAGERRLSRSVSGPFALPIGRAAGLAARTRAIDAEVARALGRGTDQIVLLGAGYDGRALRFGGTSLRWFEVDLPATQGDKRRRLRALGLEPAGVAYIGLDLGRSDLGAALDAAEHDPHATSLFVCESLLDYLTLETAAQVCRTLRARAPAGSALVATFVVGPEAGPAARGRRAATHAALRMIGEPRRTEFRPGDPQKLMVVTGWHVARSESTSGGSADGGTHTLVLVCEPAPQS
jgi:methyltransferase (TIGR00027 family)